jgi:protein O-GlcNAc transferase
MSKNKPKKSGQKLSQRKQKPLSSELSKIFQLAYSCHQRNDFGQAQALYQKILSEQPSHPDSNFFLGMLVFHKGQYQQSEILISKAALLCPTEIRYLMGLGILFLHLGEAQKAFDIFSKAVNLAPRDVEPISSLGTSLQKLARFNEAEQCFYKALTLNPKHLGSLNNMGNVQLGLCEIEKANDFFLRAFEQSPETLNTLSNTLLNYNYFAKLSPLELFQKHKEAGEHFPSKQTELKFVNKQNKKIRIAYISADFKIHSVAYFLLPLFKNHDRKSFEIYCFYNGDSVDAITEEFQSLSDYWQGIKSLNDEDLRRVLIESEIDILIDLSGHTADNRLAVFATRVAPVQMTWLGYPHSTGIPEIDIRIVDKVSDPSPVSESLSTEKLVRLPHGFLCYEGSNEIPYNKQPPCIGNGYITFGSFNNLAKVNQKVIKAWSAILRSTPNSKLIIKSKQLSEASVQQKYLGYFESCGISSHRVTLLAMLPSAADHLSIYNQIDIALDTFPYNGTTTTCEAMWMGVPTTTFVGDRHSARVGASIMTYSGFIELVSSNEAAFVSDTITLASQTERLSTLRKGMRARMQNSDLCNAKQFALQMEAIFKKAYT